MGVLRTFLTTPEGSTSQTRQDDSNAPEITEIATADRKQVAEGGRPKYWIEVRLNLG